MRPYAGRLWRAKIFTGVHSVFWHKYWIAQWNAGLKQSRVSYQTWIIKRIDNGNSTIDCHSLNYVNPAALERFDSFGRAVRICRNNIRPGIVENPQLQLSILRTFTSTLWKGSSISNSSASNHGPDTCRESSNHQHVPILLSLTLSWPRKHTFYWAFFFVPIIHFPSMPTVPT